jgi:flavin reductase (DIM6/NTAB) family NADH-FMN oxidoreductase RutF
MHYVVDDMPRDVAGRIWSTVLAPRPVALIVTSGDQGFNIAPYNSVAMVANNPPTLCISFGKRKHAEKNTLVNIRRTPQFTVNVVPRSLAETANAAAEGTETTDDFARTGLTPRALEGWSVPAVAESPAAMSCSRFEIIAVPGTECTLVLAHVSQLFLNDDFMQGDVLAPVAADLIASIGVEQYISLGGEQFAMPRTWE